MKSPPIHSTTENKDSRYFVENYKLPDIQKHLLILKFDYGSFYTFNLHFMCVCNRVIPYEDSDQ